MASFSVLSLLLYFIGTANALLAAALGWFKRWDAAGFTLAWAVYAFVLRLPLPNLLAPETTVAELLLVLSLAAMLISWWAVYKRRLELASFWLGWAALAVLGVMVWK